VAPEIRAEEKMWKRKSPNKFRTSGFAGGSTFGASNIGSVSFYPLESGRTRIILWIKYDPSGLAEIVANLVGIVTIGSQGSQAVQEVHRIAVYETGARPRMTGQWRAGIK